MRSPFALSGKFSRRLTAAFPAFGLALLWTGMAHGVTPYLYLEGAVPFYIERPTVKAFFSAEQENETRSGPFIDAETDTTTTRQKLDIRTHGWAYHPALVIFDVGLRPDFKQQTEESNRGSRLDDDRVFMGYFLDTTWLQAKPYTINLYTARDRSDTTSSLSPDITTETSVDRGRLLLKYPALPTTLTVESRESVTEGFYRTVDANDAIRLESRKDTQNSRTTLEIETREQDRQISSSASSTDIFSTFIRNTYNLSSKSSLSSGFSYHDSSSELRDTTATRISSRLRVKHRKNLSSHYSGLHYRRDDTNFSSDSSSLSAGLTHLLYENLTTSFNASTTRSDFDDGDLDTDTASLDFHYRRRIPWGRVNMNLGFRERIEDDQRTGTSTQVLDEPHTFVGISTQVFLDNINIDIATVIVRDSTGLITYVEGIDYIVDTVGNSTRITRDPLAGIGDNQSVLVDYSYVPDPPAKTGLTTITFGTSLYLWDMLTLFYQRSDATERLISGQPPNELTDDTVQKTGAELKWRWSTSYVEIEDRDTRTTPLKRFLVRETLTFRPVRNLSLGIGAEYSELELKDTGEVTEGSGINANLVWNIGPRGQLRARAYDRRTRSAAQQTENKGLVSIYDWWFGAWRPSIRYELLDDNNEFTGDARRRHIIYFQIERIFR